MEQQAGRQERSGREGVNYTAGRSSVGGNGRGEAGGRRGLALHDWC